MTFREDLKCILSIFYAMLIVAFFNIVPQQVPEINQRLGVEDKQRPLHPVVANAPVLPEGIPFIEAKNYK